jgi:hypothetical protein
VINVLKYWLQITQLSDYKYAKIVYNVMYRDLFLKPNCISWARGVRNILQSLGFNDVWLNQGVGDVNIFLKLAKQRLTDNFIQKWQSELYESSRARTFVLFCNFQLQPYLTSVDVEKYRIAMSRFRMSSHRLRVETGRWHEPRSIPYNERLCPVCAKLEDEFHMLLECTLYSGLRKQYIKQYYWKHPNIPKFISLLCSENNTIVKNLAMFMKKAFDLRNEYQ